MTEHCSAKTGPDLIAKVFLFQLYLTNANRGRLLCFPYSLALKSHIHCFNSPNNNIHLFLCSEATILQGVVAQTCNPSTQLKQDYQPGPASTQ